MLLAQARMRNLAALTLRLLPATDQHGDDMHGDEDEKQLGHSAVSASKPGLTTYSQYSAADAGAKTKQSRLPLHAHRQLTNLAAQVACRDSSSPQLLRR